MYKISNRYNIIEKTYPRSIRRIGDLDTLPRQEPSEIRRHGFWLSGINPHQLPHSLKTFEDPVSPWLNRLHWESFDQLFRLDQKELWKKYKKYRRYNYNARMEFGEISKNFNN